MSVLSIIFLIVFFLSIALIWHSYLLFPFILKLASRGRSLPSIYQSYTDPEKFPRLFIFCSLHNESKVIQMKIDSMLNADYPDSKIFVYMGLDNCSDDTESKIKNHPNFEKLNIFLYPNRRGKSMVLNDLVEVVQSKHGKESEDVYIFTDANVFFNPNTLFELSKYYQDPRVGICAANVVNPDYDKGGIGIQEKFYISRESHIKHMESLAWGTMIGAFGACYSMKALYFKRFPQNFLMEDFYESMHVLSLKLHCILNDQAIVFEDLPGTLEEEFKRKRRISAGNYQNLSVYYKMALNPFNAAGFSFLSHKVLRWFTPFFLMLTLISSIVLSFETKAFLYVLLIQIALYSSVLLDKALSRIPFNWIPLRAVSYFLQMNAALLSGFVYYLKGVKSNVWQPTQRQ